MLCDFRINRKSNALHCLLIEYNIIKTIAHIHLAITSHKQTHNEIELANI